MVESSQDVGVTGVNVTAPITDTGTPAEPSIGISDAANAAKGAVQLANDPGNSGDLTTDTANDVLIKSHDELNRRIGVAVGGVTSVGGDAPIQTTTAGSDVTVSIADATTAAPGAVQLQDAVDTSSTRAATLKQSTITQFPWTFLPLPSLVADGFKLSDLQPMVLHGKILVGSLDYNKANNSWSKSIDFTDYGIYFVRDGTVIKPRVEGDTLDQGR